MAVLSALFDRNVKDYQEAFGQKDVTTQDMKQALKDCFDLYFSEASNTEDDCQRLPVVIVNKLTKTMFAEYKASYQADTEPNEFINTTLDELDAVKKQTMQYCLLGGECLLKPIVEEDKISFLPIRRDCFIPLARDNKGNITAVGTAEFSMHREMFYTLMERRSIQEGKLVIENKLFQSKQTDSIGSQVPLQTLARYEELEPEITLPIDSIGLISIKTPILNDVDGTTDGVPVFEPARKLIHNINRNEKQLADEFDLLQARIVVSSDMLKASTDGKRALVDKVFVGLDDNPEDVGINPFSPPFRETAYLNRKREYLRNIETLLGFKRGLLADVNEEDKTATEITDSKGDYNLTIIDFQDVWERAVKEACTIATELAKIYGLPTVDDFDVEQISCDFGDGVLYNRDKAWAEQMTLVNMGLLKPELALAWYYGMPADTEEDLQNIRERYIPNMAMPEEGESVVNANVDA